MSQLLTRVAPAQIRLDANSAALTIRSVISDEEWNIAAAEHAVQFVAD